MIRFLYSISLLLLLFMTSCDRQPDQSSVLEPILTPLPHAAKGYELYSWQEDREWFFTLTSGTNRQKSVEEITSGDSLIIEGGWVKITLQGTDAVKSILAELPEGEEIFWAKDLIESPDDNPEFRLPSDATVEEITQQCNESGIELHMPE